MIRFRFEFNFNAHAAEPSYQSVVLVSNINVTIVSHLGSVLQCVRAVATLKRTVLLAQEYLASTFVISPLVKPSRVLAWRWNVLTDRAFENESTMSSFPIEVLFQQAFDHVLGESLSS
jgi:hypothetical protein